MSYLSYLYQSHLTLGKFTSHQWYKHYIKCVNSLCHQHRHICMLSLVATLCLIHTGTRFYGNLHFNQWPYIYYIVLWPRSFIVAMYMHNPCCIFSTYRQVTMRAMFIICTQYHYVCYHHYDFVGHLFFLSFFCTKLQCHYLLWLLRPCLKIAYLSEYWQRSTQLKVA